MTENQNPEQKAREKEEAARIAAAKKKAADAPDREKLTAIANYLAEQVENVFSVEAENIIKTARDLIIEFAVKM